MKPKRKFKSAIPPKIKVKWGKPPKLSCTIKIDDTPKHRAIFPKYIKNKPYPYAPPLVSMQPLPPPNNNSPNDDVWNTSGLWVSPSNASVNITSTLPPTIPISVTAASPPPRITINPPSVAHWGYGVGMAGAAGFYTTSTALPGRLVGQQGLQGPVGPTGPIGPIGDTGYGGYYTSLDINYTDDYYGYSSAAAVAAPVEEEYEEEYEEEVQQIKYMINENVLYVNSEDVLKRLNVDDEELYERFMEIMMEISNKAVDLGDSDPNKIKQGN